MNNTKGVNKNISKEETKYIELLCNEKADIILKTEFGTGRYKFVEFKACPKQHILCTKYLLCIHEVLFSLIIVKR